MTSISSTRVSKRSPPGEAGSHAGLLFVEVKYLRGDHPSQNLGQLHKDITKLRAGPAVRERRSGYRRELCRHRVHAGLAAGVGLHVYKLVRSVEDADSAGQLLSHLANFAPEDDNQRIAEERSICGGGLIFIGRPDYSEKIWCHELV